MNRHITICVLTIFCLWNSSAFGFWGSESTDTGSGLDVTAGFDVNTIKTITGSVTSQPERKGQGQEQHTVMTVTSPQGAVTVILGPWWYWEKQNLILQKNQEITIAGSLAQGKDGTLYLFTQKIENHSTGESVTLRSETGKPYWSRGSGSQNGSRSPDANSSHSGSGARSGGMRGGRR